MKSFSLVSQCHHGIDLRRAAGWNVARKQRSRNQKQNHCSKGQRIRCRNYKEQGLYKVGDRECASNSDDNTGQHRPKSLAQHHRQNVPGAGAQRYAYADFSVRRLTQ